MRLLVKLIQSSAVPQSALDLKLRAVVIDRQRIGGVGLQLDGIATGALRRLHQRKGAGDVAVMIARQFRDDIRRLVRPDQTAGNGKLTHHECSIIVGGFFDLQDVAVSSQIEECRVAFVVDDTKQVELLGDGAIRVETAVGGYAAAISRRLARLQDACDRRRLRHEAPAQCDMGFAEPHTQFVIELMALVGDAIAVDDRPGIDVAGGFQQAYRYLLCALQDQPDQRRKSAPARQIARMNDKIAAVALKNITRRDLHAAEVKGDRSPPDVLVPPDKGCIVAGRA